MIRFRDLRRKLELFEASKKDVKTFTVGKRSKAVIRKMGSRFAVYIDGELLDDDFRTATEAENGAMDYAEIMRM